MEILASKGERIFIDKHDSIFPITFLDNKLVFSIDIVTQFLHQGTSHGTMECCIHGCKYCDGLDNFNDEGFYDEPHHPDGYEYQYHAVAIIGAGNLDRKNCISVRDTRGPRWQKKDMWTSILNHLPQLFRDNEKDVYKIW